MDGESGSRASPRVSPETPRWSVVQVLGVCTCFVGFRTFTVLPARLQALSAAYFVPYYTGLLLVVLPAMYVQLKLGGATQRNIVSLLSRYTPILKGIGIACIIRMFIFNIYFNVICAYALFYTFTSLSVPYPWSRCDQVWNTAGCQNITSPLGIVQGMAELQFFENRALQLSHGISEEGAIPWHLGLSLLAAWFATFILICGGIRYFGWTVTVTGSVAMVVSIAVLAYGREEVDQGQPDMTLYATDWATLADPSSSASFLSVWIEGILEGVTVSLVWHGVLPSIGKYGCRGPVRGNVMWVAFLLFLCIIPHIIVNMMSCFLSALSRAGGITLGDIMSSQIRTVFVMMPAAFSHMGIKRGLSFVFFFMVFLFCANTQALFAVTVVDNLDDGMKHSLKKCCTHKFIRILLISSVYCALGLVLSIPNITEGGLYLVTLVDVWIDRLICFVVFFSMLAYTQTYAKQKFHIVNRVFVIIWFLVASLFTTAVSLYSAGFHKEPRAMREYVRHGIHYTFPKWAYIIGWFIAGGPIIVGLLYGVMHAFTAADGTGITKCINVCTGSGGENFGRPSRKVERASGTLDVTFSQSATNAYMKARPF